MTTPLNEAILGWAAGVVGRLSRRWSRYLTGASGDSASGTAVRPANRCLQGKGASQHGGASSSAPALPSSCGVG